MIGSGLIVTWNLTRMFVVKGIEENFEKEWKKIGNASESDFPNKFQIQNFLKIDFFWKQGKKIEQKNILELFLLTFQLHEKFF